MQLFLLLMRVSALLLLSLLEAKFQQVSPSAQHSSWHGASDASAADDGSAIR